MTATARESLNDFEFDSVFEIRDGIATARHDIMAPELYDGAVWPGWELITGYSGQDRYPGPIMHNSEFLGGRMESDILAADGVYVVLVAYWPADADGVDDEEGNVEGWAVARQVD